MTSQKESEPFRATDSNSTKISQSEAVSMETTDLDPAETIIENAIEKQPIKRFGCLYRIFKFGVIFLLILSPIVYWNIFRGKKLEISPETTLITEPLFQDKNVVDYAKYVETLYPPEMKTDENGARIVIREIGPYLDYPRIGDDIPDNPIPYWKREFDKNSPMFKRLYDQLGLDPNIPPRYQYQDHEASFYYQYLEKKYPGDENGELREKKQEHFQCLSHWRQKRTDEEQEFIKKWIAEYSPTLDVIADAVQRKIFLFPVNYKESDDQYKMFIGCSLQDVKTARSFARSFNFRALQRINEGNIKDAVSDVITTKRLGKQFMKTDGDYPKTFVEILIGVAMNGSGGAIPIGLNPDAQPTRDDWQRLLDEETTHPISFKIENSMRSEHLSCINLVSGLANFSELFDREKYKNRWELGDGIFDFSGKTMQQMLFGYFVESSGLDWNEIAKIINSEFAKSLNEPHSADDLIEEMNLLQKFDSLEGSLKVWSQMLTLKSRSRYLGKLFVCLFFPSYSMVTEAINRCYCSSQMQKLDYAMQLYKADHGTFPPAFTVDAKGNPLHSWRVLLLPYLGQQELFDQIKLDEPWDSEHNRAFHSADLAIYRCPSLEEAQKIIPGETSYSVIVGKNSLFDESGTGKDPLAMIKENPEKDVLDMILIAERSDPICWMKPDNEIRENNVKDYGINKSLNELNSRIYDRNEVRWNDKIPGTVASVHPGGANFALSNGASLFLSATIATSSSSEKLEEDEEFNETLYHYLFGEQLKFNFEQQ
ncbi:MAG: DUF1559 domain-containing protein [Planctomycetia bacterium]|nr:DUF1559 domain-containing protein [Planctomycetia bacterium]